jgi:hypothetical protein
MTGIRKCRSMHAKAWNSLCVILLRFSLTRPPPLAHMRLVCSDFGDSPCLCRKGYTGPRCDVSSSTPVSCTLECSNGGICTVGTRPASEQADAYRFWDDSHDDDNMYCQCPDTWDGPTCKISRVACGEHHCFHGAECLARTEGGKTVHRCDCATASDDDSSLYSGQYCQYPATSRCPAEDDVRDSAAIFCVNNGTCRSNAYEGCDCKEGFTGFSCEFRTAASTDVQVVTSSHKNATSGGVQVIEESDNFGRPVVDSEEVVACNLKCLNGGTCRHGEKPEDEAWETATKNTTHMNSADAVDTATEEFAHCVCPIDFAGTLCEHPVDECGADNGKFLCLHGSKCVDIGDEQLCDCDQADSSLATFFAGSHCEHPVDDICTTKSSTGSRLSTSSSITIGNAIPGTSLAFCVNGGTCKKTVDETEP